ncbi:MAG TPA: hypothetical protein VN539_07225 [Candidatus Saccharimonadales bacterium]|nr:hypothetical protein [Candidatus Saccharimonadales bacterium]
MPSAQERRRSSPTKLLLCLLAGVVLALFGWGLAIADDGSNPPSATPPPATDSEAHAEVTPGAVADAPAPAPAMKPDSIVTAAALRDSVEKKGDTGTSKDPEPAEHIENASTPSAEKPAEATAAPAGLSKPADRAAKVTPGGGSTTAPKVAVPKPGGSRAVGMRTRGTGKRAVTRAPSTKKRAGDPSRQTLRAPLLHEFTESDRVSSELERTERFVGRAQKSILLSKNTRAIKLFTSALDFQSDSREACKVRQYARAERLTLAARDFADRASRMVGPPREDPDYVDHVLRRTDDALERAKDVLKTGAGRYAWSQHEELKQEQKDAWRVFKSGDVGSAYKQTLGVREGVLALLRQLQDLPVPRETAEKAIGGAQAALEQASRELGPRPTLEAVRLVRLAGEYLTKARQSFSRGSYRSALLQAKVVERHVEHAVDVGRPRSG